MIFYENSPENYTLLFTLPGRQLGETQIRFMLMPISRMDLFVIPMLARVSTEMEHFIITPLSYECLQVPFHKDVC